MDEYEKLKGELDALGEEEVRKRFARGAWANRRKEWVRDWLAVREAGRAEERERAGLEFAKENSKAAREANEIAQGNLDVVKSAKNAAWAAAIAAIAAAAFAPMAYFQARP